MKYRRLSSLLILSLLMTACGGSGASESTVGSADNTAENTEPASTGTNRADIDDGIGEYDFGGKTYTIVYSADQVGEATYPYAADGENGEVLNDSIYLARRNVEERFNTVIKYHNAGGNGSQVANALQTSVLAGDEAYQLGIGHMYAGFNGLISIGALYDFVDVDTAGYIDLSRPWWNQSLIKNITINDTLLTCVSDLVYNYVDVIYFNKRLMGDYGFGDPYDMVYDGSWIWDKLIEMAKQGSKDLDGNDLFDKNDQYGYACQQGSLTTRFIHSNGMVIGSLDSNGKLGFENVRSEKMQTIVEKAHSIYWSGNMTYICGSNEDRIEMFKNGKAMFSHALTIELNSMRESEFEFGIVPLPKADEAQEGYYSMASTQMMLLPSYIDPKFAGVVLEALSAESYKHVIPALYETLYQNKYLRDEHSFEMYQIIRDSLVYDPIWVYGNGGQFAYLINNTAMKQNTDLASYVASNANSIQKVLDDVSKAIFENYGG